MAMSIEKIEVAVGANELAGVIYFNPIGS